VIIDAPDPGVAARQSTNRAERVVVATDPMMNDPVADDIA
jgi:hypothetical protein